ncbi:MAG: chromosomal replication initiator protein DnaA [Patescibacteria group bacterium]
MPNTLNEKKLWDAVLAELQLTLSELNYQTWVANTKARNLTNSSVEVICPSPFVKDRLQKSLFSLIQNSVNKIGKGEYEIFFKVGDTQDKKETSLNIGPLFETSATNDTNAKSAGLSPKFTFDNYVMGSNNRLAFAIATAVAENPGKAYNPFFIYSGVGLGKTHLMQAIGNKILQDNPKSKVIYATGEAFMNEMIEAIQSGRGKGRYNTNQFRNKYRNADVLLIDDVQFIAGKETTQEEFFHTFNTLYLAQKQIVLTSDRPPKDFTDLEDRITSRFSSGIIADIQTPDIDTRIAILRKKRTDTHDSINDDTINFIAEKINTNIRELEGAYLQVLTYAKAIGESPEIQIAAEALGQSIKEEKRKPININQIIKTVCNYYSIRLTDIKGKRRTKNIVLPRQVAMYLIHNMTETPYMSIGEILGGRDHTTIMHGVRKVEEEVEFEGKLKQDINNIKHALLIADK